jgi:hypothetical protein
MDRNRDLIDWLVIAAGVVVFILSVFADQFGYGDEGFGWLQWLGTIAGAVVAIGGAINKWRRRQVTTTPTTTTTTPTTTPPSEPPTSPRP